MIRAVTLCDGDWVFHVPSGKPVQINQDRRTICGKPVIGYDFEPIMLDRQFCMSHGFTMNPGDDSVQFLYTEKDKDETATTPAYIEWYEDEKDESVLRHHVVIHGSGCTISFNHNIAVHELQAAMRLCKISLKVLCPTG